MEIKNGIINGHEYIDLGLSVKWASCNIGAEKPSDYGDYLAWGEVASKSEYTRKYSKTYKKKMDNITGDPTYDVATANWGSTWRLPTYSEMGELRDKCQWSWTTQGGHNGYKITGLNGNSIFLPAAGWTDGLSLRRVGECGHYWSATPYGDNTYYAYDLYFFSMGFGRHWGRRYCGQSVRPIME